MKKLLDFKSIGFAGIIVGILIYYAKDIFGRGSFTIDNIWLFLAFAAMVMWCLTYMLSHMRKLAKTNEEIAKANEKIVRSNEEIVKSNEDIKLMLKTIVENQLHNEINMERLHENTRVLFLEAIADLEDLNGGNKRKVMVR